MSTNATNQRSWSAAIGKRPASEALQRAAAGTKKAAYEPPAKLTLVPARDQTKKILTGSDMTFGVVVNVPYVEREPGEPNPKAETWKEAVHAAGININDPPRGSDTPGNPIFAGQEEVTATDFGTFAPTTKAAWGMYYETISKVHVDSYHELAKKVFGNVRTDKSFSMYDESNEPDWTLWLMRGEDGAMLDGVKATFLYLDANGTRGPDRLFAKLQTVGWQASSDISFPSNEGQAGEAWSGYVNKTDVLGWQTAGVLKPFGIRLTRGVAGSESPAIALSDAAPAPVD